MDIDLSTFSQTETIYFFLLAISFTASAFFSAIETALTSLPEHKVKHLIESNEKYRPLKLWEGNERRVLTTILIGNNFVNILAAGIVTMLSEKYFHDFALGLATGITTLIILIVGEIIPKTYAKTHSLGYALLGIRILSVFYYLLYPLSGIFASIANLAIKHLGTPKDDESKITEDELEFLINVSEEEGGIREDQSKMLSSIFDFDDTVAKEVMIPRTSMSAISSDASLEEILDTLQETGHSRIPVYEEQMDNIIGILYAKDLLPILKAGSQKTFDLLKMLRKPFFIPDSKKIGDLFKEMKRQKLHIAIVLDEYGGTAGLLTMEDLIEEIVGEIRDEYDHEEDSIKEVSPNNYIIQASWNIDDFKEHFDIDKNLPMPSKLDKDEEEDEEDEEEFTSVGGYFLSLFGAMPKLGDEVKTDYFLLKIEEMDGNRIEKISMQLLIPFTKEGDAEQNKENKKVTPLSTDKQKHSEMTSESTSPARRLML